MIPMSLAEIARVVSGRVHGTPVPETLVIDGPVVTDSREAAPGSLYVARIGESADGHDFVPGARDRGAVAALTMRQVGALPCVVVDDVQAAFVALARSLVDRREDLTVIGITGSSGKTSTKDLLAAVLRLAGATVAPVGSYNSEVGVPLTVCQVTEATRFLVLELGARGIGQIEYLIDIAPPRVGVELNVGSAHLGEFGSREAIADAKAELVRALPQDGLAVLNADDHRVRAMVDQTQARVVLVGEADDADVRARDVTVDEMGRARFTVTASGASAAVAMTRLVGRHHVGNALSVIAVALECGVSLERAVAVVADAAPASRWRMEVTECADGTTVVNDAYNANPDSMRAALATVAPFAAHRRVWAVLGSMLELGPDSDAEHASIGRDVVARGLQELLVVGDIAQPLADAAATAGDRGQDERTRVRHVRDVDAAYAVLDHELAPGDVVLLKSSRDVGLRWLGEQVAGRGLHYVEDRATPGSPHAHEDLTP